MPNHLRGVPWAELLANSSFSTKTFEKSHLPPHHPDPDYSITRSAELKLPALKKYVEGDFSIEKLD